MQKNPSFTDWPLDGALRSNPCGQTQPFPPTPWGKQMRLNWYLNCSMNQHESTCAICCNWLSWHLIWIQFETNSKTSQQQQRQLLQAVNWWWFMWPKPQNLHDMRQSWSNQQKHDTKTHNKYAYTWQYYDITWNNISIICRTCVYVDHTCSQWQTKDLPFASL